jgi:3-hydroxyisobutyrate dehydrogenase-like beta-hydroxyacid dehydrogenase
MGLGMSLNLQKYLLSNNLSPLRYSNRTLSKGDRLRDEGAIPVEKFEDVVQNSDVIFTMVGGAFVCYRMCAVLTKTNRSPMTTS